MGAPVRPLLLQAHWSDFESFGPLVRDPEVGLVARAVRAVREGGFDRVVLVTGEDPRNAIVHDLAREAGAECFAGDDADVGRRYAACMEHLGLERGARALLHHFTVDFDAVRRGFELLEETGAELVTLPRDFDLRFGADVFAASFLSGARALAEETGGAAGARLRHTPWAAADLAPERFRLVALDRVPSYGVDRFRLVRKVTDALYPERSRKVAMPFPAYEQALSLLPEGARDVLDVACGFGDGTVRLAERIPRVTGLDRDAEHVEVVRATHAGSPAVFAAGDATDAALFEADRFDAIVSIHTMEHLADDRAFLAACARWLRPGGTFVLEVPLLMEHPFPGIDTPLGEDHVREYRVPKLRSLVEEHFEVERAFGVARGLYLDLERARNAAMLVLRA